MIVHGYNTMNYDAGNNRQMGFTEPTPPTIPSLWSWNMRGTDKHPPIMEPVKVIPNSHTAGEYIPPTPKIIEVEKLPAPGCNIKQAPVQIEPSHLNLPDKLRKTLRSNWQQHLRNLAASNAFASALGLVEALRA
jgi:hypothetical protein